jgi:hypothetical protein
VSSVATGRNVRAIDQARMTREWNSLAGYTRFMVVNHRRVGRRPFVRSRSRGRRPILRSGSSSFACDRVGVVVDRVEVYAALEERRKPDGRCAGRLLVDDDLVYQENSAFRRTTRGFM